MKLVWIVPELQGGIHSYSKSLWPSVKELLLQSGSAALDPIYLEQGSQLAPSLLNDLRAQGVTTVHIQHEFGLFGRKIPPFYRFPRWIADLRKGLPQARLCATAHTVIGQDFRYDWRGRGLQAPLRWAANALFMPLLRPVWTQKTWGGLDGVIVHSQLQRSAVDRSGAKRVEVIPHFVPSLGPKRVSRTAHPVLQRVSSDVPVVMVFGYVSPEKGQELAIRALSRMKMRAVLILAGGSRRKEDQKYLAYCEELARKLAVSDRVKITGFLAEDQIDEFYSRATVVLAPFRDTSGSGSIPQGLARGAPLLASDLPLNREIAEREPGALDVFRAQDPEDCADRLDYLIRDHKKRAGLSAAAHRYAARFSIAQTAQAHQRFYESLQGGGTG